MYESYLNNFLLAVVRKRMMTITNRNAGRLSTFTPKTTSVAITIIIHNPYFNSVPKTYLLEQNKIENDIPVVAYIIPIPKNRVFRLCRLRQTPRLSQDDRFPAAPTYWNSMKPSRTAIILKLSLISITLGVATHCKPWVRCLQRMTWSWVKIFIGWSMGLCSRTQIGYLLIW